MKTRFLSLTVFLTIVCGSSGLAQSYLPMLKEYNEWNVAFRSWHFQYNLIYYTGDTTIIGTDVYYPISRSPGLPKLFGFLREDERNRKVYFYQVASGGGPDLSTENLLYDFDVSVGETYFIAYPEYDNTASPLMYDTLVVDSIGHVEILNECLTFFNTVPLIQDSAMVITLHSLVSNEEITWVEGMGSTAGPLMPGSEGCFFLWYETICFHQDGQKMYQSNSVYIDDIDDCMVETILTSVEPEAKNAVVVYPNPTTDVVSIKQTEPSMPFEHIAIFDTNLRIVYENTRPDSREEAVSLGHLPNGMYTVRVRVDGQFYSKRISLVR